MITPTQLEAWAHEHRLDKKLGDTCACIIGICEANRFLQQRLDEALQTKSERSSREEQSKEVEKTVTAAFLG
jgi:hypothetical protein